MSDVVARMESARVMANGTLPMHIVFKTPEEVAEAKEWMKGKKKVKNLSPMLSNDPRRKFTPMETIDHK